MTNQMKNLPAIDDVLRHPGITELMSGYRREIIVGLVRQSVDTLRKQLRGEPGSATKDELLEAVVTTVARQMNGFQRGTLQPVVNGTGVVLHTNMGRAPLSQGALEVVMNTASSYSNLELDLATGDRGSRYWHLEALLTRLTGAEAALVVNNNAAAVLLGLNTLANEKEVIVSRGQLVEIGGAFRIPEVMKSSGARLVEVGTTNKTYPADFEKALSEETALLFAAHTSNYKIVGFTREIGLSELVALGKEHDIPVMHDLGSGILFDLSPWGLKEEPTVQASVATGADIITFSGDKLLGGPQAGIIVGKKKYIEAMKRNQLLRALRVDKLILAALEGTLRAYLTTVPDQQIPVIQMLTAPSAVLENRSRVLCDRLIAVLKRYPGIERIAVTELEDMVGGGAYPGHQIPGFGVEIQFRERLLEKVTRRLRLGNPAMITRTQDDKMLISIRTLLPEQEEQVVHLLDQVLESLDSAAAKANEQGLQ